jgi:predicted RNase H-like HicB family nuclease
MRGRRTRHTQQHLPAGGADAVKLLVIMEQTGAGYSAYSLDLPGCVAAGSSKVDVEQRMREAIEFHVEVLRADRQLHAEPHTDASIFEVAG